MGHSLVCFIQNMYDVNTVLKMNLTFVILNTKIQPVLKKKNKQTNNNMIND